MTDSGTLSSIGVDLHLAFINNSSELALNFCVQNFTDVFCTEASIESFFADTYTDHVTLSGMHNTFDAV